MVEFVDLYPTICDITGLEPPTKEFDGVSFKEALYKKNVKLKDFVISQFKNGMSWDNHGDWHIDHIIPLSLATTEEEMIKLCHYTNLQPLWAEDNLTNSNKII